MISSILSYLSVLCMDCGLWVATYINNKGMIIDELNKISGSAAGGRNNQ